MLIQKNINLASKNDIDLNTLFENGNKVLIIRKYSNLTAGSKPHSDSCSTALGHWTETDAR